jgi:hypothetical protein
MPKEEEEDHVSATKESKPDIRQKEEARLIIRPEYAEIYSLLFVTLSFLSLFYFSKSSTNKSK